ncbi:MAG: hypothetical protein K2W96_15260 [Gemmataceae bacterium]|nr:hypothetical protein [Gemmataceae bacterium]
MTAVVLLALCAAPPCKPVAVPVALRAAPVLLSEREIDRMLQTEIDFKGIEDAATTLEEFLRDHVGRNETNGARPFRNLRCVFDEQAPAVKEGTPVAQVVQVAKAAVGRIDPVVTTFETLLVRVLDRMPDADFLIRRGHLEITTKTAIRRELRLGEKEPYPVLLRFMRLEDESLESACEKIAERLGATIVIDPKATAQAATKVKATFRNVPLDAAVETLAEMAGLKVVRKSNVYYLAAGK